jgi:S-adenosylmethionine:tRNA ribosyltransferase-isomerase
VVDHSAAGIELARVELQVGLATFRPITAENVGAHEMHAERIGCPKPLPTAVDGARRRGGRVVAIGTTVVRTLESRALGTVEPGEGETRCSSPRGRFRRSTGW